MPDLPVHTCLSLNAQWPGFASTRNTADPWSVRCRLLARAVHTSRATVVAAQELGAGEAQDLSDELGHRWHYQRNGLNAVLWRDEWRIDDPDHHDQSRDWQLPDGGQYERTLIAVRLVHHHTGRHVFVASTHLATGASDLSAADAQTVRGQQTRAIRQHLHTYRRVLLCGDFNSRLRPGDPRAVLTADGWTFTEPGPAGLARDPKADSHCGIDAVGAKDLVQVESVTVLPLGRASDHAGHVARFTVLPRPIPQT